MPTITVENYLKTIYTLRLNMGEERLPLGALARASGVTPGTATTMMKRLDEAGLVDYESRRGVKLTEQGQKAALLVIRKARLIELFLIKHLDFDWTEVHEEAELLEHAVSDRLLERIDDSLGQPAFDPHGDPIPNASGEIKVRDLKQLSTCSPGMYQIARVDDHSSSFLSYLDDKGLHPGDTIELSNVDRIGQVIQLGGAEMDALSLSVTVAEKLYVISHA